MIITATDTSSSLRVIPRHTMPVEFENPTITVYFRFVFKENSCREPPHDYHDILNIVKSLRYRDGVVWSVGLTTEITLRFQISLGKYGRGLVIL